MTRPRVVFVPGFTQTAASWRGVLDVVGETCDTAAFDIPARSSLQDTLVAIAAHGRKAIYVGYSMGGRLCLRLALDRPDLVEALVLVSTSPGIADAKERAARVTADEELARSVERDGVDAFLTRWMAQPMFASVPPDAPGLSERRRLDPAYLASSLRLLGTGAMEPMWHRLRELRMPVALVTGTRDVKFEDIALRMLGRMSARTVHIRLEGGHALPLEQPAVLGGFIVAFASEHRAT